MRIQFVLLVLSTLFFFSTASHADARLEKTLGLNTNQAQQVHAIQKQYRRTFSATRQELNREMRKLRRARIAHDSGMIARQEHVTALLQAKLEQIRLSEDAEIRRVLTPQQRLAFEDVIQQRNASVGSSRDVKSF